MKSLLLLAICAFSSLCGIDIQKIMDEHVTVGMACAEIDRDGVTFYFAGDLGPGNPGEITKDTIFEIDSLTKTFTDLLMLDASRRGELELNQTVAEAVPQHQFPEEQGKTFTFSELAIQTSGLPRLPTNFTQQDIYNPYADYTPAKLYEMMATYDLERAPGETFEYSNLGIGLLGQVVSEIAGGSYEELIADRVIEPLGLMSTGANLVPIQGYRSGTTPTPAWTWDALAGAGVLRSTIADMARYVQAQLGLIQTPLNQLMKTQQVPRIQPASDYQIAMGFFYVFNDGTYWADGSSYGYNSVMAFNPKLGRGLVILSNEGGGDAFEVGFAIWPQWVK